MSYKRIRLNKDHITEASDLMHEREERGNETSSSTAEALNKKYTLKVLRIQNNVIMLTVDDFHKYSWIEPRLQELHSHITDSLEPNKADDPKLLEQAKVFSKALLKLANPIHSDNDHEPSWIRQMAHIWEYFGMEEHFSYGQKEFWSYDADIMNFLPGRKDLRQPKPDYAFGLDYDLDNPEEFFLARAAFSVMEFSEPAVDIVCSGALLMPFLVGEAKSMTGTFPVARQQMCNALIKCHDNLSALKLSEQLIIYSFVHVGHHMTLYFSVSVLETNEKAMSLAKRIFVVKVDEFLMNEQGTYRFLKFVEHVKAYGMGTYATTVKQALTKFAQDITAKGLVLK